VRDDITCRTSLMLYRLKDVGFDGNDGMSIGDRLLPPAERAAEDIRYCSNVCDAYGKKSLLAKVLQGPLWDAKLLKFVQLFSQRRQEFEFELTLHRTIQVDRLVRSPLFRDPLLLQC
jgi:hypothetical protein